MLTATRWEHACTGPEDWDAANAVQLADDGGYIMAGGDGFGYDIIKVDSRGEFLWGIVHDGYFYVLERTTDGGYIAAGAQSISASPTATTQPQAELRC